MDQFIRKLKIIQRFQIRIEIEIHIIIGKSAAETVIMIDHAGNAVKSETVKMIFFLPELQVAQQKMQNLHPAVVEQFGAPCRMPALSAFQKILSFRTVLKLQAFTDIRARVAVHHVKQHADVHSVRFVHKILQVFRIAVPVRRREKVGNLIAKGTVIRMLLNCHQLYCIVAKFPDARQYIVREFPVCADSFPVLAHTDMRLINQRRIRFLFDKLRVRPGILLRIPYLCAECFGFILHCHACAVGRQPCEPFLAAADPQFHKLPVFQAVRSLQRYLPYAVFSPVKRMALLIPFIEFTEKVHFVGAGHPFPEDPSGPRTVKTEIQIAVGKAFQRGRVAGKLPSFFLETVHPELDISCMRFQPGINPCDLIGCIQLSDIHAFSLRFLLGLNQFAVDVIILF